MWVAVGQWWWLCCRGVEGGAQMGVPRDGCLLAPQDDIDALVEGADVDGDGEVRGRGAGVGRRRH